MNHESDGEGRGCANQFFGELDGDGSGSGEWYFMDLSGCGHGVDYMAGNTSGNGWAYSYGWGVFGGNGHGDG